ncbi:MAG: type II secretion system protein M [Gammaproteobacteria bacterium]|nr:type II secretion system protein M [Gammaproteobacteria bacterium]
MNDIKVQIKTWFDGLNPRERKLVLGTGIFLVIFFLHQLVWEPLVGRAAKLEQKVAKQQQDLLWMQQAAQEVSQLSGGSRPASSGSLLGVIERTARQSKLGDSIRKVQPEGKDGVRVWLDKAPFDDVMHWLDGLQTKQGVSVTNFSVERQSEPGRVNVRISIGK